MSDPVAVRDHLSAAMRQVELTPPISLESELASGSSFWTHEELSRARRLGIVRYIKAGWKFVEGLLQKGQWKSQPSMLMPFDPRKPANLPLRHNGKLIAPNRWLLPNGLIVDGLMALAEQDACLECGGEPWFVKTAPRGRKSRGPWDYDVTYCRQCVTQEELEDLRQRHAAAPPAKARRRA